MFIVVKYGSNESLLCNPCCAVVNLLSSIKRRTGMANNRGILLDLSDVTGLVKDLDTHKGDSATKHLNTHTTYILVEKQILQGQDEDHQDGDSPVPNIQYIPLLENYAELFPEYRLHFKQIEKKRKKTQSKSPSPAGIRGIKSSKTGKTQRSNSKRGSIKT